TSPTALPSSPEHGENGLPASTSGTQFQVLCILADEIDREICELDAGAVESEFETFLGNLVSIGYPHPLIYTQAEAFDIDNPTVIQSITYVVSIAPDSNRCQNNRESGLMGFYRHRMQQIILCLIPNAPLLDSYKHLIRHEYYHATQVAFPNTEADFTLWSWEKWIIEGTASVAERSDQFGLKRTPAKSLHYVDRSLKSEEGTDEYKAQDFWVFLGQASGSALDRFITLFQQGATTADVANWIGSLDGLKNWYWRWVKNQVMVEENITFEGELGQTCTLQSQVVESMRTFDLYNDGMHLGTLPPMTSHVIKLEIAPELEGFPQIWVWVNDEPFNGPDPDLKYKVYVDGETCTSIPDYNRYLHNITAAKDYYVVVSNTNPDSSKNYTVFFD
ncbi:MAG: hypothetical protein ACE5GO_11425, partial [Anaerolineales bacterium]